MEKKSNYGQLAVALQQRMAACRGGVGGGGGDDGDSDDDWDDMSDEWSEDEEGEDDEMGFGLFDDISEEAQLKEQDMPELEGRSLSLTTVEVEKPKLTDSDLGRIFSGQHEVSHVSLGIG